MSALVAAILIARPQYYIPSMLCQATAHLKPDAWAGGEGTSIWIVQPRGGVVRKVGLQTGVGIRWRRLDGHRAYIQRNRVLLQHCGNTHLRSRQ